MENYQIFSFLSIEVMVLELLIYTKKLFQAVGWYKVDWYIIPLLSLLTKLCRPDCVGFWYHLQWLTIKFVDLQQ